MQALYDGGQDQSLRHQASFQDRYPTLFCCYLSQRGVGVEVDHPQWVEVEVGVDHRRWDAVLRVLHEVRQLLVRGVRRLRVFAEHGFYAEQHDGFYGER